MHEENRQNRSRDSSLVRSFPWAWIRLLMLLRLSLVVGGAVHRRRSSCVRPLAGPRAILWATSLVPRERMESNPRTMLGERMVRLISRAMAVERLLVSRQSQAWMRRVRVHCPMPLVASSTVESVRSLHRCSTARRRCSIAEPLD